METRIALIGIIVEDGQAAEKINRILHDYSRCIIGRMGLPYREREISNYQYCDGCAQRDDQCAVRQTWHDSRSQHKDSVLKIAKG